MFGKRCAYPHQRLSGHFTSCPEMRPFSELHRNTRELGITGAITNNNEVILTSQLTDSNSQMICEKFLVSHYCCSR